MKFVVVALGLLTSKNSDVSYWGTATPRAFQSAVPSASPLHLCHRRDSHRFRNTRSPVPRLPSRVIFYLAARRLDRRSHLVVLAGGDRTQFLWPPTGRARHRASRVRAKCRATDAPHLDAKRRSATVRTPGMGCCAGSQEVVNLGRSRLPHQDALR